MFRTSRWPSPAELFAAHGFGVPTPALTHLVAASFVVAPTESSDGALAAALGAAGINLPALAEYQRTCVLWAQDAIGNWVVSALLLESAEPFVRGDRLRDLRIAGFTVSTDTAATAALFTAAAPAAPAPLALSWGGTSPGAASLAVPGPSAVPGLTTEIRS